MMSQNNIVSIRDIGGLGCPPLDKCILGQWQAAVMYLGFFQLADSCVSLQPFGRYGGEWVATVLMFVAERTARLLQF